LLVVSLDWGIFYFTMAFALPMFPEYSVYDGVDDEENPELNSHVVVGRRTKRAPMLGVVDRRHSAPNMGQRVKKSPTSPPPNFGATDDTNVKQILRQKQAKKLANQLSLDDTAKDTEAVVDDSIESENHPSGKRQSEPVSVVESTKITTDQKTSPHKPVSRGESVLVLLRRLSSGRLNATKPAKKSEPKLETDDSEV